VGVDNFLFGVEESSILYKSNSYAPDGQILNDSLAPSCA
jgi:hypothetical protein